MLHVKVYNWIQGIQNKSTNDLIKKIEKNRNTKVILICHKDYQPGLLETMFDPGNRYLCFRDLKTVQKALVDVGPDKDIDIILHTLGGMLTSAQAITNMLSKHNGKVCIFIPRYSFSAGTVISVACDEIYVNNGITQFGPFDPQFHHPDIKFPCNNLIKLADIKDTNKIGDKSLLAIEEARKATYMMECMVNKAMKKNYSEQTISDVKDMLNSCKYTHGHSFDVEEMINLGLKIKIGIPPMIEQLFNKVVNCK